MAIVRLDWNSSIHADEPDGIPKAVRLMGAILLFGDGDHALGAGHHIRLAAIADALEARGLSTRLACRDLPGSTHTWAWRDRPVVVLPGGMTADQAVAQARVGYRTVVIDHYDVTCAPGCVAVVDGPGLGPAHEAALVICPRPGALAAEVPGVPSLAGASYLPLRPAFAVRRGPSKDGPIMVAVGATDPGGLRARIMDVLQRPVMVLPGGEDADAVAERIASCSCAVVSASTIAVECLAIGVPVVAVISAPNQERLAAGLAGLGVPVLPIDGIANLPALLGQALAPVGLDGGGAGRIAERIVELERWPSRSCLRWATWDDADLLHSWANDADSRAASFSSSEISHQSHLSWLARTLSDPAIRIWIGESAGRPAGTVRLNRERGIATVSIAVAAEARGCGMGRQLLGDLMAWTAATGFAQRLIAWVKDGNQASQRLFAGSGWQVAERGSIAGSAATRYEFVLEPRS